MTKLSEKAEEFLDYLSRNPKDEAGRAVELHQNLMRDELEALVRHLDASMDKMLSMDELSIPRQGLIEIEMHASLAELAPVIETLVTNGATITGLRRFMNVEYGGECMHLEFVHRNESKLRSASQNLLRDCPIISIEFSIRCAENSI